MKRSSHLGLAGFCQVAILPKVLSSSRYVSSRFQYGYNDIDDYVIAKA